MESGPVYDWKKIVRTLLEHYGNSTKLANALCRDGILTDPSTLRAILSRDEAPVGRRDRAVWLYLKAKEIENGD